MLDGSIKVKQTQADVMQKTTKALSMALASQVMAQKNVSQANERIPQAKIDMLSTNLERESENTKVQIEQNKQQQEASIVEEMELANIENNLMGIDINLMTVANQTDKHISTSNLIIEKEEVNMMERVNESKIDLLRMAAESDKMKACRTSTQSH